MSQPPSALAGAPYRRIRKRRRVAFGAGMGAMLVLAVTAAALGSGCIFDQGDYQGGGRRTGAPTATDTATSSPTSPGTTTPTGTQTPSDSGSPGEDAGALDN
ncbi:MAG: hypothetical protein KIS78_08770 [Labilithrix sp.]|nr:hypothetical protein [Labilithrix sp.]MCW5832490.1 hypothetical protein [Labilithrix sp.]